LERLERLIQWIDDLTDAFRSRHGGQGEIFLFSDHGMANVTSEAELDIERVFGRARPDRYLFFLDGTMARAWLFDETLREPIGAYLRSRSFGTLIDEEARARYGVASRHCGDLLFLLHEGVGLCPTFFGRRTPKALHGYAPELESQQGVLLYTGPRRLEVSKVTDISLMHPLLDQALRLGVVQ